MIQFVASSYCENPDLSTAFNLIDESWLPVRRHSGAMERIQPWRVTERIEEDPYVAFAWPRPDFNGAAHEFLIGLLSTAAAPDDDEAWDHWWLEPPSPDELKRRFSTVAHAFDLHGPGPRFLQDIEVFESGDAQGKKMGAFSLLINTPGRQALDNNADLFVKRDPAFSLGRAAAAMALYALSAYAPRGIATGGRGHRQSLRKAGPLTTLVVARHSVLGDTLWGRLWPNVQTKEQIAEKRRTVSSCRDWKRIFPWLTSTCTSVDGKMTTPEDVHALHAYWGMPRRIRLVFREATNTRCGVTGELDSCVVPFFHIKPYGINYSDGFEHPLTPYRRKSAGKPLLLPITPERGGVSYRHWPVIQSGDSKHKPALVVRHWFDGDRYKVSRVRRILAFGYFGSVGTEWKPRAWIEGEIPLWRCHFEARALFSQFIEQATAGAYTVAQLLEKAVRSALVHQINCARGYYGHIEARFYGETEAAFLLSLGQAESAIREHPDSDDPTAETRRHWASTMETAASRLFDEYAPSEGLEDRNMQRHVKARFYLTLALRGRGKAGTALFEGDLGIPSPEGASARKSQREAA